MALWIPNGVVLRYPAKSLILSPNGKGVIITGEDYDRKDVLKYTPKGITWFFSKTEDELRYKIEEEMKKVL